MKNSNKEYKAKDMRKVLMIAHCFPPDGGSGTYRTLKFVKFLPNSGWQPFVLTAHERYHEKKDFSVLGEIPDCTFIFRTLICSPFRVFMKMMNYVKASYNSKKESFNHKSKGEKEKSRFNQRFVTSLRIVDNYLSWLPFAVLRGLFIIRKHKIDTIFSTSPDPKTHIVGFVLQRITGLKWLADFRDPWVFQKAIRRESFDCILRLEKYLEKKVMERSTFVICNTKRMLESLREQYSYCDKDKFVYIPNGYDPDDFKDIGKNVKPFSKFTLVHTGEFYRKGRTPDVILEVISGLIKSGKIDRKEIQVIFVGGGEYADSVEFRKRLEELDLVDVVGLVFHQPQEKRIEYLYKASVLLLLQPGKDFVMQVPAKVFEYAYVRKPILTIAPDGATADFVKNLKTGVIVEPDDFEKMKNTIFDLYRKFKRNQLNISPWDPFLNKFSRKNLANELVKLMEK